LNGQAAITTLNDGRRQCEARLLGRILELSAAVTIKVCLIISA
jgi:hypothetical protein